MSLPEARTAATPPSTSCSLFPVRDVYSAPQATSASLNKQQVVSRVSQVSSIYSYHDTLRFSVAQSVRSTISMSRFSIRWQHLISLLLPLVFVAADVTTTVLSVTSTTTVHVTATDYAGACDNFVGACVVYGTARNAPYTTTVYVGGSSPHPSPPPPPSVTTSTTTIVATTTASKSGDCSGFVGACVVYATNSHSNAPASTVYYAGGNNQQSGVGNAQGYIGPKASTGGGFIGAASIQQCSRLGVLLSLVATFGLVMWI